MARGWNTGRCLGEHEPRARASHGACDVSVGQGRVVWQDLSQVCGVFSNRQGRSGSALPLLRNLSELDSIHDTKSTGIYR